MALLLQEPLQSARSHGRISRGAMCATIIRPPGKTPAAPMPAIDRPTIKTTEEGEVAHTRLPISKMVTKTRNDHFSEKYWNILPARGWKAQLISKLISESERYVSNYAANLVKRNALPYQPTSSRELKAVVMVGIAVASTALS